MNINRFKASLIFALLLFVLFASQFSQAAVIGANKGVINYNNVLKNGYAQELVTFTTDTDFNLSVNFEPEGAIKDWVRLEPANNPFFISKNEPYTVAIIVEPPSDARIEKYDGAVRFITGALAGPDAQFGTAVRAAIAIKFGLQVTGQEILSCSVLEVSMEDVEEGYPFEMYTVISNSGNVRIKPDFVLEFWNQDQTAIVQTINVKSDGEILPTVQKKLFNRIEQSLPIGQYWVKLSTPMCGPTGNKFYTVSVIERGGVSDKGELLGIENSPDAGVGQIVPIDAVFENKGSRIVSAKFKGTITSGSQDNIFKIIDTEPIDVAPGEIARLRTYFNPVQEGQYYISGRVLYNRKLTFEKASVLNVREGSVFGSGFGISTTMIILIIMLLIIIVLVILILKKRKDRNRQN